MSAYLKKNIIPLGIEIVYIISCFIVSRDYYIYANFVFYSVLLIYFIAVKDFSIKEWGSNLKKGKTFWKSVWVTAFFFILAFVITTILENAFPHLDAGTIG
ncbi:MAG: CPBP family intramembrane metalloprotease, partial [Lachnospiraceae bacterium]|nr:CPBP family intramembrane metalloprotease [Lachnospiraceae bacterium]